MKISHPEKSSFVKSISASKVVVVALSARVSRVRSPALCVWSPVSRVRSPVSRVWSPVSCVGSAVPRLAPGDATGPRAPGGLVYELACNL